MKKSLAIIILLFPIIVFAQLSDYKASFSFGGGATQYFGDLSHRFVNLKLSSYSANAALQYKPTKGIGIELEYKYVNLFGDDRADYFLLDKAKPNPNYNRSLNFKSTMHEANLKFYFYLNNGKIMSKYAVVSPYFFVGIGAGLFNSKSDLLSETGSYYYYWNDGTIRDLAETDPLNSLATIITKDKKYETNLNDLETEAKYSNFKWQIPLGFGLNFKLSKNIYLSLQTEWVYNSTDYLDGVGNKPKLTSYPNSFVEYAADPANTITGTRGNDNKWKDSYLNTTMKFNFYFGNKERKIAKNISSNIIVPAKDYNSIKKADTIKNIIDTSISIIKEKTNTKDTVVLIYKLIENVYVAQANKRDTIIIYKTINKIKADTLFKLDTILKNNDSITIYKTISKIKLDTTYLQDTILKTPILKDSTTTNKIIDKIKLDTIIRLDTLLKNKIQDSISYQKIILDTLVKPKLKATIVKDSAAVFKQIDSVNISEKTKIISDTIIKKAVVISSPLLQDSSITIIEENEITNIPIQIKSDTIIGTINKITADTITSSNKVKLENNISNAKTALPVKVVDTVVIVNTNKNKDSIVLTNHLLLKNIYSNLSSNNLLYDSISQKLSTIISKNNNTKISEKVAVKNDTIYKYVQLNNLSKEQVTELNNFKKENENIKIKLEKQKAYNDSLTRAFSNSKVNTQNLNSNLQGSTLDANANLRTNNQAPVTNLLPSDLQEIIRQEFQRNNANTIQVANTPSNQDLLALKQEVELLKHQLQNKNTRVAEPIITTPIANKNEIEIASLRTEIENLKKTNKTTDTVYTEVKTPISEIKNEEITSLKNEIEQLKNKSTKVDTVIINTKNETKDVEINSLKSDLIDYKNELEQIKAKQKLATETKPKVEPKDSLLTQVFFATNQISLDEQFNAELNNIYMMLLLNPDAKLLLTGFADRDGDKKTNLKLSAERAQSVKNYFVVGKKINYNRILMNYVGSNLSNTTDNKNYNRRVDVYLLK